MRLPLVCQRTRSGPAGAWREAGLRTSWLTRSCRGARSPQRALCRTLTGFPDSPVGPPSRRRPSGHLVPVGRHDSVSRRATSCSVSGDRRRHRCRRLAGVPERLRDAGHRRRRRARRRPPPAPCSRRRGPVPRAVAEPAARRSPRPARALRRTATSSRSPPATRWSPASARPWSTCSAPTACRSSRPCRRSRWPAPGWAGRRSPPTSSPSSAATRAWCCATSPRAPAARAVVRRQHAGDAGRAARHGGLRRARR